MLVVYYESTKDADYTDVTDRVRLNDLELTMGAEEGNTEESTIEFDDPLGDFEIVPWRRILVFETEGATGFQLTYAGWINRVKVGRVGKNGTYKTGPSRYWTASVQDSNALLNFRILHNVGKRPAETSVVRMDWLLGLGQLNRIVDYTYVNTTSSPMDADVDYNGQYAKEVFDDICQMTGDNYWIIDFDTGPTPDDATTGIWVGPYALPTVYDSDIQISNDLDDIDEVDVFAMWEDTTLDRNGDRVHSGAYGAYDGGAEYIERTDTSNQYTRRDVSVPMHNIKTKAKARQRLTRHLADVAIPEDVITTTILVPASAVNRARHGMRIQVRSTHLPDTESWTWFRILRRTVKQQMGMYEITMDLGKPTPGTAAALCSNLTATGSYYPLGGSAGVANLSDGNVFYLRPGIPYPEVYTPGHQGIWHFPVYGAGGSGTVDQAGDCGLNIVRCLVVGDGEIEVHTSVVSAARNMTARLMHADPGSPTGYIVDEVQTGESGDTFTFTVSTHGGANCTHWVDVGDDGSICGGKWGFDGFDWTAD